MDSLEQIKFVLNFMGFDDKTIKSITYEKYWSNSDELVWVATISDSNYKFYPDETLSAIDFEQNISQNIFEVLGYRVIVIFILILH